MGKLLIAAMLMLVAGESAIAEGQVQTQASRPRQVSMQPRDWKLQHSANVDGPLPPPSCIPLPGYYCGKGWSLVLRSNEVAPANSLITPSKDIWFLVTTKSPVLTRGQYIKMVGFVSMGPSAQCWMYLQQVGSALFGDAYYSWRSAESVKDSRDYGGIRLLDAETRFRSMPELIVDLEPKFWISTETGERGGASAAATARFQQALANPQSIGIMCLGASYVVGAIVSFEMLSLAVCDPLADPSSVKQENAACARPNALQR